MPIGLRRFLVVTFHNLIYIKAIPLCDIPLERNGIYSVKSGYRALCEEARSGEASGSNSSLLGSKIDTNLSSRALLPFESLSNQSASQIVQNFQFLLPFPTWVSSDWSNSKMKIGLQKFAVLVLLALLSSLQNVFGIRFVIDREECFSHNIEYEGDTLHISFVVIKVDGAWHYTHDGVDLVVKGPSGEQLQDFRDKTIDFDVHVSHFSYYDQHAKDEHFNPLLDQISKLEEALYNIQFEQHWLEAQTERQAIVNDAMGRRAVHKAFFESAALVGASILQVYLLRRLFERKLGMSRV
nr:transmembrane emp24 domain-containing protein p24beta2 [Quercus suber]